MDDVLLLLLYHGIIPGIVVCHIHTCCALCVCSHYTIVSTRRYPHPTETPGLPGTRYGGTSSVATTYDWEEIANAVRRFNHAKAMPTYWIKVYAWFTITSTTYTSQQTTQALQDTKDVRTQRARRAVRQCGANMWGLLDPLKTTWSVSRWLVNFKIVLWAG